MISYVSGYDEGFPNSQGSRSLIFSGTPNTRFESVSNNQTIKDIISDVLIDNDIEDFEIEEVGPKDMNMYLHTPTLQVKSLKSGGFVVSISYTKNEDFCNLFKDRNNITIDSLEKTPIISRICKLTGLTFNNFIYGYYPTLVFLCDVDTQMNEKLDTIESTIKDVFDDVEMDVKVDKVIFNKLLRDEKIRYDVTIDDNSENMNFINSVINSTIDNIRNNKIIKRICQLCELEFDHFDYVDKLPESIYIRFKPIRVKYIKEYSSNKNIKEIIRDVFDDAEIDAKVITSKDHVKSYFTNDNHIRYEVMIENTSDENRKFINSVIKSKSKESLINRIHKTTRYLLHPTKKLLGGVTINSKIIDRICLLCNVRVEFYEFCYESDTTNVLGEISGIYIRLCSLN